MTILKNKNILVTVISLVVIGALFCVLVDTLRTQMNPMMYMTFQFASLTGILALVGLFVFEEKGDERIELHKKVASRFGYIAGLLTASIGLVFQSISHTIDPWLLGVVIVMITAKLVGRLYSTWKN